MTIATDMTESIVSPQPTHHQILIVGGGSAGITVAAQLLRRERSLEIAIVEPSAQHYYQPAWTLVGGGAYAIEDTVRSEQSVIPADVTWIQDAVTELQPDRSALMTRSGRQVTYDYLVLCPGIQIDWHRVEGLTEAIGKNGVCSNYAFEQAPYTWECIRNFKGGNAIFTVPATPIKCGGAPQKIMYLAAETFQKSGVRDQTQILFCSAMGGIFPVPAYAERLLKVAERYGADLKFQHNLKAIRGDRKEAVFQVTSAAGVEEVVIPYEMIHVTPPMSSPDFIKNSPLAVPDGPTQGWVNVDRDTLVHKVYPNVFSLGDASSLPTSKTAAAIRRQAPVVVTNLLSILRSQAAAEKYDGYTCCPLITSYGKVIMAEFDYRNQPLSSFPLDPREERYSMWLMKRHVLPWLYWNRMLQGHAFEGDALGLPGWQSKPS
jgi:sulfide:quinone oxidoreductase